ncbi:tetratricopeptide repeat protein [Bacillus sp. JCM 19034]|uniref:tetratricopeptide repeat protein n=1 Tax=Bacillus sp. JCM 19034 TaxID=1481928 RepID=UPI000783EB96|nr:tetratricopeptide repeat protein [Bacillus sp. JCM 19034]
MIRKSDLSEEELLEKEDDWWEREDETNLSWIMEGKKIFTNLLRINRREIRYRETLSYLLLMQGEDLKLRKRSYKEAIKSFNEVVKLDPENARAYYRLGFLYFYQEEWAKSIDSFQRSLRCYPRQSRNRLEKEQQVKAHYYILKATQIISKEFLKKVERFSTEDLMLFGEMHQLLKELKVAEQQEEKSYQMIVNGTEYSEISEREYEELSDPFKNKDYFILNQRSMNDVTLSFDGREISIPATQVPLLEFLMRHPEGVRSEVIIQRRYRQSRDPYATLRRSISRLRDRLEPLYPLQDVIQTIEGGYRWNSLYEFRMFKHNRDVSTDLLLD